MSEVRGCGREGIPYAPSLRPGAMGGRSYSMPLSPRPRVAAGRSNRTTEGSLSICQLEAPAYCLSSPETLPSLYSFWLQQHCQDDVGPGAASGQELQRQKSAKAHSGASALQGLPLARIHPAPLASLGQLWAHLSWDTTMSWSCSGPGHPTALTLGPVVP